MTVAYLWLAVVDLAELLPIIGIVAWGVFWNWVVSID